MNKKDFEGLLTSMQQAIDIAGGKRKPGRIHHVHVPKKINVKAIRKKLAMTQAQFAATFGFAPRTLKSWESGERQPESYARILLNVIAKHPEAVIDANRP